MEHKDAVAKLIEQDAIAEVSDGGRLPTVKLTLKIVGMAPACWSCGAPLSSPGRLLVTTPHELATEVDHIIDRRQLILLCPHCDTMLVRLEGTVNWTC